MRRNSGDDEIRRLDRLVLSGDEAAWLPLVTLLKRRDYSYTAIAKRPHELREKDSRPAHELEFGLAKAFAETRDAEGFHAIMNRKREPRLWVARCVKRKIVPDLAFLKSVWDLESGVPLGRRGSLPETVFGSGGESVWDVVEVAKEGLSDDYVECMIAYYVPAYDRARYVDSPEPAPRRLVILESMIRDAGRGPSWLGGDKEWLDRRIENFECLAYSFHSDGWPADDRGDAQDVYDGIGFDYDHAPSFAEWLQALQEGDPGVWNDVRSAHGAHHLDAYPSVYEGPTGLEQVRRTFVLELALEKRGWLR